MLEMIIDGRPRDLGHGLEVLRVLPYARKHMVGPFIFVDHAGPIHKRSNEIRQADIRPHPHIGLSTVSYLLGGAMTHRDTLGSEIILHPGEINWMTAGSGIAHSERFDNPGEMPSTGLEFIQTWVALPNEKEETDPGFEHHPSETLPIIEDTGIWARLLLGEAYGKKSSVSVFSPIFYLHAVIKAGSVLSLPEAYSERAAYIVRGKPEIDNRDYSPGQMAVFTSGHDAIIRAKKDTTLILLGGEPVGERHIWWNFVSSSKDRIEQAKADYLSGKIQLPPNDNSEFIPLPDN